MILPSEHASVIRREKFSELLSGPHRDRPHRHKAVPQGSTILLLERLPRRLFADRRPVEHFVTVDDDIR
jgi:hypothetical protein